MKSGMDYIIVKSDSQKNDTLETSILGADGKPLQLQLNTEYNPHHHAKIDAEVYATPDKYGNSEVIWEHTGCVKVPNKDKKVKRVKDFDINLKKGDKVYFHYLTLTDDQFIDRLEDGSSLYYVYPENIYCSINDGKINPVMGTVFIEPYFGDDVVDVEYDKQTIKARVTESDIVSEIVKNPKHLQGKVSVIGEPEGFDDSGVREGDIIFYTLNSDFENDIEGNKYYIMRQWDLFAKLDDNKPTPLTNWLKVDLELKEDQTENGLYLVHKDKHNTNKGTISQVGEGVDDLKEGDVIHFKRTGKFHYIEEYDCAFIRKEDVLVVEE
jgi:co-chaperonin GroES (HSP10)